MANGGIRFRDRADAGRQLAARLSHLKDKAPVVLALPRGGVAIGYEVAQLLRAPLDIVLVRKIGVPWQPELAVGAVSDGEHAQVFLDRQMAASLGIGEDYLQAETRRQLAEIERRRAAYGAALEPAPLDGRTAIVVDDGIATGATMRVALRAVGARQPARLVLAAPVAAPETLAALAGEADEAVCVATPAALGSVGYCYEDFHQMSDQEVRVLLGGAARTSRAT